jgi:acyl-coenzyme A synthetase/AMP-(fatty) acid ligase
MVDQCAEALRPIRQLLAGGDVLSPRHVQKALATLDDGVVINGYGPTENTTFTCCFRMDRTYEINGPIPIGQPIAHTTIHILDESMNPVPDGEAGELYTGGAGVAFGYLNNPELTRAKFLPNPFASNGDRLYRTGDKVRRRADGNLEFLGRFDDQVKLRGHLVEPTEIEANLTRHPDVRQTVVLPYTQAAGDKHLVAYIVAREPARFSASAMRRFLAERLPQQLIPAVFLCVDHLPLNPNGKIDRAALPVPDMSRPSGAAATDTATQARLVALWNRILHCEPGLDDNFFDLGGNSLQLIQLHSELSALTGHRPPITVLFEKTTIRTLAAWLDGDKPCASPLLQAQERADRQRLAFSRSRIRGIVG